ncbi:MAG TPA: hypothetical protein VGK63_07075 [Candidatus Limnocylindrales bacterium]
MLMPEDLLRLAQTELAARRGRAAARATTRATTNGRSGAIRVLGHALVAAGSRLEGRPPGPALVPPARHDPCDDEAPLPRAA